MNSKIDKVIVKCYRKKAEIEEKFARYKTTFDVLIQQIEESEESNEKYEPSTKQLMDKLDDVTSKIDLLRNEITKLIELIEIAIHPEQRSEFENHLDCILYACVGGSLGEVNTYCRKDPFLSTTPLHIASRFGHIEIVRMLLEKGMPVNGLDINGQTPLIWACQQGHTELVRLLLENGANVNLKDESKSTALHEAVVGNQLAIVQLLWNSGADELAKNEDDNTPLQLARILPGERSDIIDYLSTVKPTLLLDQEA